jgi:Protein of unknown function (DUF3071)
MRELRLVAVNDDGSRLLLRGDAPEPEFTMRIDERLHAALRGDRARLGQLEIQLDSQLRPRDIQARVRAGESVEQVAATAGIPVERVMRFAGPVLAEREHIADRARRCAVRRPGGEGPAPLLEDTVTSRLEAKGVALETLQWDAWRRDDGRWLVVTSWQVSGKSRAARWLFDPAGRSVTATDDEARWLAGEHAAPEPAAAPARLAVVPAVEAPEDAPAPADVTPPTEPPAEAEPVLVAEQVSVAEPAPAGSPALIDEAPTTPNDQGRLRLSDIARHIEETVRPAEGDSRPPVTKKQRASVPTWDEIMFGRSRRHE